MEYKIVEKEGFTVVGMKHRYKPGSGEISKLWDRFIPREGEIKHREESHVSYGLMGNFDHKMNMFDYMAGLPVTSPIDIPDGMEAWDVSAAKYAVFASCLKTLNEDYDTIYNKVVPQQGLTLVDSPNFEQYDERFTGGLDDPIDIYVTIQ